MQYLNKTSGNYKLMVAKDANHCGIPTSKNLFLKKKLELSMKVQLPKEKHEFIWLNTHTTKRNKSCIETTVLSTTRYLFKA